MLFCVQLSIFVGTDIFATMGVNFGYCVGID